jgi:hypothetical protein
MQRQRTNVRGTWTSNLNSIPTGSSASAVAFVLLVESKSNNKNKNHPHVEFFHRDCPLRLELELSSATLSFAPRLELPAR